MGRLVEILPAILREVLEVTLMLVGDGVERPQIEARIHELGLEQAVRLTGAVAREELHRFFNLGQIFVGVSDRTNANLPPVEAMVCAKPLVALSTGGTRHLIEDGVTGLLVAPAAWRAELPRVLVDLLRDRARQRRMGEAGRAKILREFPTVEERQRMEVALAASAAGEGRECKARGSRPAAS
jgi:glycosyltransferase involved in cell wall biosynthesis